MGLKTEGLDKYLCLLDATGLDCEKVTLNEYTVRRYSSEELDTLLASPPGLVNCDKIAGCPWLLLEKSPPDQSDDLKSKLHECEMTSAHYADGLTWYPFGFVIQALNLLKPAENPVNPVQFYKIPARSKSAGSSIERFIYAQPSYDSRREPEDSPPYPGYCIEESDVGAYQELTKKMNPIVSCSKTVGSGLPPSDHVRIALNLFNMADRMFCTFAWKREMLLTLIQYSAAMEALFITESEQDVRKKLAKRVPRILSEHQATSRNLINKMYWIRSKAAHGARPLAELRNLIELQADDGINSNGIPRGPYSTLFVESRHGHGFLSNLRELARRSIMYSLDKMTAGHTKEDVIRALEG